MRLQNDQGSIGGVWPARQGAEDDYHQSQCPAIETLPISIELQTSTPGKASLKSPKAIRPIPGLMIIRAKWGRRWTDRLS
jgi:hypothetical protein